MSKYIKYRCYNRHREFDPAYECRGMLGGVSVDTLKNHDFRQPYKDIRYCQSCKTFWRITLRSLKGILEYEVINPKHIKFVDSSKVFTGVDVQGRKIKGRVPNDKSFRDKGKQEDTK